MKAAIVVLLLLTSCTSLSPSGQMNDVNSLVEEFSIEEAAEDDPRIVALGLPLPLLGSAMNSGVQPFIAFRDEKCGPLPNVRVFALGGQLNIEIVETDAAEMCVDDAGRLVIVEMTLVREFSSMRFTPNKQ